MESLSIDRIYDYMYHLISEYAKLQDFVPVQPPSALEICIDSVLCFADDKQKQFLKRSIAFPSPGSPCSLSRQKFYNQSTKSIFFFHAHKQSKLDV